MLTSLRKKKNKHTLIPAAFWLQNPQSSCIGFGLSRPCRSKTTELSIVNNTFDCGSIYLLFENFLLEHFPSVSENRNHSEIIIKITRYVYNALNDNKYDISITSRKACIHTRGGNPVKLEKVRRRTFTWSAVLATRLAPYCRMKSLMTAQPGLLVSISCFSLLFFSFFFSWIL